MNRIKIALLWFTAGIAGFILGFALGRATAKRETSADAAPTASADATPKAFVSGSPTAPKFRPLFRYAAAAVVTFALGYGSAFYMAALLEPRAKAQLKVIRGTELHGYVTPRLEPAPYPAQILLLTDPPKDINGNFITPNNSPTEIIRQQVEKGNRANSAH